MSALYSIPPQTIDNYDYPGAVFTLYTGSITFPYDGATYNYDSTPLMVFLTTPPWGGTAYVVQWASSAPFADATPYTYDGKTVYWRVVVGRSGVTFNPDLSAELKDTNTNQNAVGYYGAWLMVYGGYTDKYIASNSEFTATADAIREKTGDSSPIEWEEGYGFASAIADIPSGGSPVEGLTNALEFRSASSFTLEKSGGVAGWEGTIEWTDGTQPWSVWNAATTLTASSGVLYLRGTGNTRISPESGFALTGTNISCNGNIETLLDYASVARGVHPTMGTDCFKRLFAGCTSLVSAPALPAIVMSVNCYNSMFYNCSALAAAPALPAKTLATSCYSFMFYNCTAITTAPVLSATTVAEGCCQAMFYGCTALTTAPVLQATELANNCYNQMFSRCYALTAAPALPATELASYCYQSMFSSCTALTSAPALPATTLTPYCYNNMFSGCTALTTAPALPATTLANRCYYRMFYGCAALTSAPALSATTQDVYSYGEMFYGCISLTSAPALTATTLADSCYWGMFHGCTALASAPVLPATTLESNCYREMFYGCTALTSVPALPATTLGQYCYQAMFRDCTSLTSVPALPATTLANYCYGNMFRGCTSLKLSKTYDSVAYPYTFRVPKSGTGTTASSALYNMFASTGGSFKGTPSINTDYYTENQPVEATS